MVDEGVSSGPCVRKGRRWRKGDRRWLFLLLCKYGLWAWSLADACR